MHITARSKIIRHNRQCCPFPGYTPVPWEGECILRSLAHGRQGCGPPPRRSPTALHVGGTPCVPVVRDAPFPAAQVCSRVTRPWPTPSSLPVSRCYTPCPMVGPSPRLLHPVEGKCLKVYHPLLLQVICMCCGFGCLWCVVCLQGSLLLPYTSGHPGPQHTQAAHRQLDMESRPVVAAWVLLHRRSFWTTHHRPLSALPRVRCRGREAHPTPSCATRTGTDAGHPTGRGAGGRGGAQSRPHPTAQPTGGGGGGADAAHTHHACAARTLRGDIGNGRLFPLREKPTTGTSKSALRPALPRELNAAAQIDRRRLHLAPNPCSLVSWSPGGGGGGIEPKPLVNQSRSGRDHRGL